MATITPQSHPTLWKAVKQVASTYWRSTGGCSRCVAGEALKAGSLEAKDFNVVDLRLAETAVALLPEIEREDLSVGKAYRRAEIVSRNPWLVLADSLIVSFYHTPQAQ